jgi:hypothetical protein
MERYRANEQFYTKSATTPDVNLSGCRGQAPQPHGHAPERLHEEISADYNDMANAATHEEVETRRTAQLGASQNSSTARLIDADLVAENIYIIDCTLVSVPARPHVCRAPIITDRIPGGDRDQLRLSRGCTNQDHVRYSRDCGLYVCFDAAADWAALMRSRPKGSRNGRLPRRISSTHRAEVASQGCFFGPN